MLICPIRNCLQNLDLAFLKFTKSLSKSAPVSSMNTCVSVWLTANISSKVAILISWNRSSISKGLKTQSIHDHVVVDNCCILLYSLVLMFAHLIWSCPLHESQQTAQWLWAIVLEQTLHFSGFGFGEISPLTTRCVNWIVEFELGYLCILATRYLHGFLFVKH